MKSASAMLSLTLKRDAIIHIQFYLNTQNINIQLKKSSKKLYKKLVIFFGKFAGTIQAI
jgi:hypothetical protein